MAEKRHKGLRSIQAVLKGVLTQGPFAKKMRTARLRAAWKEAAGEQVSRETLPLGLKNGTFVVGVSSPAWAQELMFQNERFLVRLRERVVQEPVQRILYKAMNDGPKKKGDSE